MSSSFVKNLLIEQRRRSVATLMKYVERDIYPRLPQQLREELREQILSTLGGYHDLCLDVLKASASDGIVVNEEALALIEKIHGQLADIRAHVGE